MSETFNDEQMKQMLATFRPPEVPAEAKSELAPARGSALVGMAIGDYVAMLERQNKYLRKELHKNEARLKWLHDCSTGQTDSEGYEWGIYRVKWERGQAVSVMQTNSDLSDLDAEMARELNTPNTQLSRSQESAPAPSSEQS